MEKQVKILKGKYAGKVCNVIGYQKYMFGPIEITPMISHRLVVVKPKNKQLSYLFDNVNFLSENKEVKPIDNSFGTHQEAKVMFEDSDKYLSIPLTLGDIDEDTEYIDSTTFRKDIESLEDKAKKQLQEGDEYGPDKVYIYKLVKIVYKESIIKTILLQ